MGRQPVTTLPVVSTVDGRGRTAGVARGAPWFLSHVSSRLGRKRDTVRVTSTRGHQQVTACGARTERYP